MVLPRLVSAACLDEEPVKCVIQRESIKFSEGR
jgi:hypothetical protein